MMKSITTILLILFISAVILLGLSLVNAISQRTFPEESTSISQETQSISPSETKKPIEGLQETSNMNNLEITSIEIYLDGDRNHGIFLGKAEYGLPSPETESLYGNDFKNCGFKFSWENRDYNLEPGTTHYLYIYAYSPSIGWDYIREEIRIPGDLSKDPSINLFIDSPKENEELKEKLILSGWAVDTNSPEGTGIKQIEVYLNGPKGTGFFLGNAEYGRTRQDVADAFRNQNFVESGYNLYIDINNLEPGSKQTLFVYAISEYPPDSFGFEKREIIIGGTREEKTIINTNVNLENYPQATTIEITGWAINKQKLSIGTPSTGKEYKIKKIIFVSNRQGNDEIYSINIDGTELTKLTDYPGNDMYPEASPDGKKIAYTSDINGTWQIMVMDWNGQNKTQLTNNPFRSGYPSWSFDGKYIYFEGHIDGNWELFRINSDGTNQVRLTVNPRYEDWHPAGHPLEYKIVYESGITGHEDLYIMNHDGTDIQKICKENQRRRTPHVLYDGSKIVYVRYTNNQPNVWIMDFNGENEKKVTDNSEGDGHPAFSPDGKYIAYEERKGGAENIILMGLNGENKTNITNHNSTNWDPSFLYQE